MEKLVREIGCIYRLRDVKGLFPLYLFFLCWVCSPTFQPMRPPTLRITNDALFLPSPPIPSTTAFLSLANLQEYSGSTFPYFSNFFPLTPTTCPSLRATPTSSPPLLRAIPFLLDFPLGSYFFLPAWTTHHRCRRV